MGSVVGWAGRPSPEVAWHRACARRGMSQALGGTDTAPRARAAQAGSAVAGTRVFSGVIVPGAQEETVTLPAFWRSQVD